MPFTFSHPAYILVLKYLPSKYVSFTGLIIGSIVPDFEYFLRMDIESRYSHSFAGILYFNLPVVFLISILFHLAIKSSLLFNIPRIISSRFGDLVQFDFLKYLKTHTVIFIISAIIGILSHLCIDAFTHKSGYFVREFTFLNSSFNLFSFSTPWYRLLQHVTSITGLAIIFFYILKLPKNFEDRKPNLTSLIQYWLLIIALSGLLILLRYIFGHQSLRLGYWAVNVISCCMISLTVVSIYWKMLKKTN